MSSIDVTGGGSVYHKGLLPTHLPYLPFANTTLPKKKWENDRQEKKGRVIDLEKLAASFTDLDDYLTDSDDEEEESSEQESSDEEYYTDDEDGEEKAKGDDDDDDIDVMEVYGGEFDWVGHVEKLLPGKAELGKPPPKLVKKIEIKKKEKTRSYFEYAQYLWEKWKEKQRKKRYHPVYKDYERQIAEYAVKYKQALHREILDYKREVMKEVTRRNKRRAMNDALAERDGKSELEITMDRYNAQVAQRDVEEKRMKFYCTNLQLWATEKHQHKLDAIVEEKARQLEKDKEEARRRELEERAIAKAADAKILDVDLDITAKIMAMGRKIGMHTATNVFDKEAADRKKEAKRKKKENKGDFTVINKDPILHLKLVKDIEFKDMRRNGNNKDGKKMVVFDHPDLSKTRHVTVLKCQSIGERGALSLAAEFIRGACPLIELFDLSRCQIQTRGLGRLLHGVKLANLMSLKHMILRSNDLTARAIDYLEDAFLGGSFPSLEVLDIRENEFGDIGLDIFISMIQKKCLINITHLYLLDNNITDKGFIKFIKVMESTSDDRLPYIEKIDFSKNPISSKAKKMFKPLPPWITV